MSVSWRLGKKDGVTQPWRTHAVSGMGWCWSSQRLWLPANSSGWMLNVLCAFLWVAFPSENIHSKKHLISGCQWKIINLWSERSPFLLFCLNTQVLGVLCVHAVLALLCHRKKGEWSYFSPTWRRKKNLKRKHQSIRNPSKTRVLMTAKNSGMTGCLVFTAACHKATRSTHASVSPSIEGITGVGAEFQDKSHTYKVLHCFKNEAF